jgi:S1 RNA binding domain protein
VPQEEQGPSPSPHPEPDQPTSRSPEEKPEPSAPPTPPAPPEPVIPEPAPTAPAAGTEPPQPAPEQTAPPTAQAEASPEAQKLAVKGDIVEATVRRLAPFGAFVRLADGRKGLVHISQVAEEFVEDVREHLKIGQVVQARITAVADDGKVDLSIKKAKPRPKPKRQPRPKRRTGPDQDRADAKPPKRSEEFHVNPLADVFVELEKKLK